MSLKRYARSHLAAPSTSYLLVPGKAGTSLRIESAYVQVTFDGSSDNGMPNARDETMESRRKVGRARIVGDPGSGKSTFVKKQFRIACHHTLVQASAAPLPILVELKEF